MSLAGCKEKREADGRRSYLEYILCSQLRYPLHMLRVVKCWVCIYQVNCLFI